jgi:fructokinase
MEVITDVEALAIDAFWAEVKTSKGIDLAALHDEPIISAAFIVARGIGGAIARSPGYILRGKHHAEMGHFPVSPHASDPLPKSACDMHPGGQCVTSRASLVALAGRAEAFGMNLSELFTDRSRARDDRWTEFWSIEASYLGQLCASSIYTAAPTHIVMAGTIIESAPFLIPMIQKATLEYLGGGRVDDDPYRRLMTGDFIKAANRYKGQIHGAILHQLRGELTQSS